MGCSSEKVLTENDYSKNKGQRNNSGSDIDLNDIENQGESKHEESIKINNISNNNEEIVDNYYNYNLNDLKLVDDNKMKVKRIENIDDSDSSEEDNDGNSENNKDINIEEQIEKIKKLGNIPEITNNNCNRNEPEDKKPPNLEKLRKNKN